MLVDSHCHLDFPDFKDELDGVVARAKAAGIGRMVTISTRVRRQADLLAIAERFPDVFCSVGTHPHHAHEELDIGTAELVARTRHPKVVAIGEAGLDYHYDNSPARRAGAGLPRPYRRRPRDRPAAGDPCPRGRRRRGENPARGDEEGRLPGGAALLHRRPRARLHRHRARALRVVHRHPDLQENRRAPRHRRGPAGRPHPGRDRLALSRARQIPRQALRAGLCGRNRQGAGRDPRRLAGGDRRGRPPRTSSGCSARCRGPPAAAA